MPTIDRSFLRARPIALQWSEVDLYQVGTGGIGSWLLPHVVRVARVIGSERAHLKLVDPDIVEEANILRQNFSCADVGLHKARVLALRFSAAWGIRIAAITERFTPEMLDKRPQPGYYREHQKLTLLLGCVDNAAARQAMARVLEKNGQTRTHQYWWLDCGNSGKPGVEFGQVLLGSAHSTETLKQAFRVPGLCIALPSPAMQAPDLLVPRPEEEATAELSCEELALVNSQSLMINQAVASIAADYLLRLLVTRNLKKFASYTDLPSGTTQSSYTAPAAVARVVGHRPDYFTRQRHQSGPQH